jgi:hypothetical protein
MSSAELRELRAYYALFSTYELPKPVSAPDDLSDGAALWVVLASVCVTPAARRSHAPLTPVDA